MSVILAQDVAARVPDEAKLAEQRQIIVLEAILEQLRDRLVTRGFMATDGVLVRTDTDGTHLCLTGRRGGNKIRIQLSIGSTTIARCVRGRRTKYYESSPTKSEELDLDDLVSRALA